MKPGDKVMIVTNSGYCGRRLHIVADVVKAVHKTGHIVLEGDSRKFRADGSQAGPRDIWSPRPDLRAWDDALWQEFQRQRSNAAMASKLKNFGDLIARTHDDEKCAEMWQELPFSLRKLVEKQP